MSVKQCDDCKELKTNIFGVCIIAAIIICIVLLIWMGSFIGAHKERVAIMSRCFNVKQKLADAGVSHSFSCVDMVYGDDS